MAKAGKNLEVLKTGWTYGGRVHLMGEIVPVPPGLTPMDEEEQMEYYNGRVFYRLTDIETNVGGKKPWVQKLEPKESVQSPGYLAPEGQTEFGGGSSSVTPIGGVIPRSELPDELPAGNKKRKAQDDEDEETETKERREPIRLKKKIRSRHKGRLVAAQATKLSSRR